MFKGWSGNKIFFSIYPLPALLTPLACIPFTTEEITGCIMKRLNVLTKLQEIRLLVFLLHILQFQ